MKHRVKRKKPCVDQFHETNQKNSYFEAKKNEKKERIKALANYRNQKYRQYCKKNKVYSQSSRSTRVRPEHFPDRDTKIDAWNVNETDY